MLSGKTTSPVLTDSSPIKEGSTRVGIHSNLMSISTGLYISNNPKMKKSSNNKVEDVLCNGWLEAMRSSSPPRRQIVKDLKVDLVSDDSELGYSSWMAKHPSALSYFKKIGELAYGKRIAIFLDYDGTLSPIVDDPDRAFMSDEMRDAVRNVAKYFPTAIISGRSRDKVYELVGLRELHYAGSHGMDIMGPKRNVCEAAHTNSLNSSATTTDVLQHQAKDEDVSLFQPAMKFLPMITEVFKTLEEKTMGIEGAKVEDHKFCTSVHYRNVNENSWTTIAQRVHDVLKNYPLLRLTHGRKVLEVRPVIDWDKGRAVEFLLESLGLNRDDDVLPIFIGDDTTDEDAFKVLRKRKQGFGILVSQIPKETEAFYSLKDPLEVKQFLKALVKWKEQSINLQGDSSTK